MVYVKQFWRIGGYLKLNLDVLGLKIRNYYTDAAC